MIIFNDSADSSRTMPATEAPGTLRVLISLARLSALKAIMPNNPKQDINTASSRITTLKDRHALYSPYYFLNWLQDLVRYPCL